LGILLTGQHVFQDFAEIVLCLGPLTDAEWMGCASLPGYATLKLVELSAQFAGTDISATDFFSSKLHVKYPRPTEDLALIRMLLKWTPDAQCTVQQVSDHDFSGFQPSSQDVAKAIRQCTFEQLGKLVFDSIIGGVPVPSSDLLTDIGLPHFQIGFGREHTASGQEQHGA
jgi:hypothetical protein